VKFFTMAGYTRGRSYRDGKGIAHVTARRARSFSFARATQAFQENVARSGPVAGASYALVGGILLLGGLGYFLDSRWGTAPWLLLVGLVMGIVVGFYELIKTVWPR
jgi:F0F1-type ATP synthase assembly protein I